MVEVVQILMEVLYECILGQRCGKSFLTYDWYLSNFIDNRLFSTIDHPQRSFYCDWCHWRIPDLYRNLGLIPRSWEINNSSPWCGELSIVKVLWCGKHLIVPWYNTWEYQFSSWGGLTSYKFNRAKVLMSEIMMQMPQCHTHFGFTWLAVKHLDRVQVFQAGSCAAAHEHPVHTG